ncbi:hypothetical protein [Marisediminicola sp. LYQ134]|uniref:hypothetical protein n=1 Tax=unclassified Marisediminicola TaxID=2618316 RepID=UPI003983B49A
MAVAGLIIVAVALVLAARAGLVETRIAGNQTIPLWINRVGYKKPWASVWPLGTAIAVHAVGTFFCLAAWGSIAMFITPLVFVPPFIVIALHNRSARADASAPTG